MGACASKPNDLKEEDTPVEAPTPNKAEAEAVTQEDKKEDGEKKEEPLIDLSDEPKEEKTEEPSEPAPEAATEEPAEEPSEAPVSKDKSDE